MCVTRIIIWLYLFWSNSHFHTVKEILTIKVEQSNVVASIPSSKNPQAFPEVLHFHFDVKFSKLSLFGQSIISPNPIKKTSTKKV